jgi:trimeric autotransporter adhesin
MSEIKVNKISPRSGTDVTLGDSGDTITIASGATLTNSGNLSVDGGTIKLDGNYPTGTNNVALGNQALEAVEAGGIQNTAVGNQALENVTTGDNNIGIGHRTLCTLTTGSCNVAVGKDALRSNTADNNTAVGESTLVINTTGCQNVAVGALALDANTTGIRNIAIGCSALGALTTGTCNVGVGWCTLTASTTGLENTAVGSCTLICNTEGFSNTAVGLQALGVGATGSCNTAIGNGAMYTATGNNNIAVGLLAGQTGFTPAGIFNVGANSNRIVIGNDDHTNAYIKIAWTVTSDARDKMNISNVTHGLDFVNKLNPVSFQFKKDRDTEVPHGNKRYGFLAQDILELEGENNVIIDNEDTDNLKYQGEALVPVLVNAIKELKAEIELLKNK